MNIALFCHSIRSDWNHGNAHFLRGVATELLARGHDVRVFEPENGWSASALVAAHGPEALDDYLTAYPQLMGERYEEATLDLDAALDGVDLVLVHEWNTPALIARAGRWRREQRGARLLFHDTHHRSITRPDELDDLDLSAYDGVLAFGEVIRQRYLDAGWTARAWTWHEAADTRIFKNQVGWVFTKNVKTHPTWFSDLVWIGNWGDDERARELEEYLLGPVRRLRLSAEIYGVRYPEAALARLERAGAAYRGWLPNYRVPEAFAQARATVHIPRRPYARALPGIPTIRVFEALACGIPLVSAPWDDAEGLFTPGLDYLVASSGEEMDEHLRDVLNDPGLSATLAAHGLATIARRHTCAHRVDELLAIARELGLHTDEDLRAPIPAAHQEVSA
jgi:spore maturation protein CgeB